MITYILQMTATRETLKNAKIAEVDTEDPKGEFRGARSSRASIDACVGEGASIVGSSPTPNPHPHSLKRGNGSLLYKKKNFHSRTGCRRRKSPRPAHSRPGRSPGAGRSWP